MSQNKTVISGTTMTFFPAAWGLGVDTGDAQAEIKLVPPEPEVCVCTIPVLMTSGCRCGQFEREQKAKNG